MRVADPLHWVVPNVAGPQEEPTDRVLVRTRTYLDHPRLDVTQGGRLLASYRLRRMIPNRSHHIPSGWQGLVRPGDDVVIAVAAPR